MSHLGNPDESGRLVNEFPSRFMSRQENIDFEEKLNSKICDFSSSSSVTSGSSDISDIPPPPPLEDDDEISHCSVISNSNPQPASNHNTTVCSSIFRSSATVVSNDNQKTDLAPHDGPTSTYKNSHPCSVKLGNGDRIQATSTSFCSGEFEYSNTSVSNCSQQIVVACEEGDNEIDKNCDLSHGECENEDCRKPTVSSCCSSKCTNSTTYGKVDCKTIAGFAVGVIHVDNIDASSVGWRHEDRIHSIFANVEDCEYDVSCLIEHKIPRLEIGRHRSDNSRLSLRSVRSKHHESQSTLLHARIDPPALNEDGSAPSISPFCADHRSDMNRALRDCFLILKVFALRCSFDHWRRKTNYEELSSSTLLESPSFYKCDDFDMLSLLSSNGYVSPSTLSPEAFSVTSVRRLRRCPIPSPFHRIRQTYQIIVQVVERVTIRRALIEWANKTKLIVWYNARLQAQALVVQCRIVEKSLRSWREFTRAALELRQKYFLMMIFNRWKCYTDECIDLRRMRYIALIHWAAVKCKKTFVALRLNATRNKEANVVTSFIQSNCGSCASTRSRNTFIEPVSRSADLMACTSIDGRGQSYDNNALMDAVRRNEMFKNDNFRGSYLKPGLVSPPSFTRRSVPPLNFYSLHGLRDGACRGRNYSDGKPSPIFQSSTSFERHTPSIAGMILSHSPNLEHSRSAYLVKRSQPGHDTTRCVKKYNDVDVPSRRPALKSTSEFIISNVLDEMISKIERRYYG